MYTHGKSTKFWEFDLMMSSNQLFTLALSVRPKYVDGLPTFSIPDDWQELDQAQ